MNPIERLAAILLLLQEKPHTSDEIALRFEVSRRTVLRDVQTLSEMGVPIIAQEGPGGGYSLPSEYRTRPLSLSSNEAFLLLLALSSLENLSGIPYKQELTSLKIKLRELLPQSRLSGAEGMSAAAGVNGQNREKPAPYLEEMIAAVQEKRWVQVIYQSSDRLSTQHLLPRQVFTQNGYWYLRAYAHEHRQERTYRIDRLQTILPPNPEFQPDILLESLSKK